MYLGKRSRLYDAPNTRLSGRLGLNEVLNQSVQARNTAREGVFLSLQRPVVWIHQPS